MEGNPPAPELADAFLRGIVDPWRGALVRGEQDRWRAMIDTGNITAD